VSFSVNDFEFQIYDCGKIITDGSKKRRHTRKTCTVVDL
jgi:hypothetical protein